LQRDEFLAEYYGAPRLALERVLDHIDTKFGGVDAFLDSVGFGEPLREELRRKLLENDAPIASLN